MNQVSDILSSILYIETLSILIIAVYSWKRRKVSGAFPLFFLCLCSAVYAFGYGMEITSISLEGANFWSKIEYLGLSFIPSLWVIQANLLASRNKKIGRRYILVLFIIPTLTCIFRVLNSYIHLMYKNITFINNGHFYIIAYEKCFWYYLYYCFFFGCIIISTVMYYKSFLKATGFARYQFKIMIYVSTSVLFLEGLDQLQIVPLKMDYGAFIMFFVYGLFAYAVYPFDVMHIIPMSREIIFDCVYDGVLVIDTDFNLKDFNCAAKEVFKSLNKSIIGTKIEFCTTESPEFGSILKVWHEGGEAYEQNNLKKCFCEDVFEFSITSVEGVSYFKARLKALYYKGYRIGSTILISNFTKEKEMMLELERLARYDQLTGILNRRYFIELVNDEFAKLEKQGDKGTLFMFDIDYFKKVNDIYGHQAGDYVLKEFAYIAKNEVGNKGLVGRYGGEEFIVFLSGLTLEAVLPIIENIRTAFETHIFLYNDTEIRVTASFGAAEYCKSDLGEYLSYKEIVKKADCALYKAKENGRNQIAVC